MNESEQFRISSPNSADCWYTDEKTVLTQYLPDIKAVVRLAIQDGNKDPADAYLRALFMNAYIKSDTWQHEREYRIVYPVGNEKGIGIPINHCGIKIRRIYAGLHCTERNKQLLLDAARANGLDRIYVINTGADSDYYLGDSAYR